MEGMLWAQHAATLQRTTQEGVLRPHPNTHSLLLGPAVPPVFLLANVAPFQAVRKSPSSSAVPCSE